MDHATLFEEKQNTSHDKTARCNYDMTTAATITSGKRIDWQRMLALQTRTCSAIEMAKNISLDCGTAGALDQREYLPPVEPESPLL